MLPLELVIAIADQLKTYNDYYNFARTCKIIHEMLLGLPWKDVDICFHPHWDKSSSRATTKSRVCSDRAVQISSTWQRTQIRHRQSSIFSCEACEIEAALLPVNVYLDCRARKVRKDVRELTISGWFPQTLESENEDASGHKFEGGQGVCAFRPEVLKIELRWSSWSPVMLSGFDLTRLRSLKMPVRAPLDCLKIGVAFMDMPHLESLTITELSDNQDFVDEFRHLGDGIMALSSSLRSLDISITNCNRPEPWETDEAFVEPGDVDFFFKAFFPEPSCTQIATLVRARYSDPREPLDVDILQSFKGQLNLEHIRLRHIGLPWWAFQTVFSPDTIKELDLLMCRMTPNVWVDLGKHAQLHKLANINYELLAGPFMSFLSTQHNLRFLSFAQPPDIYEVARVRPNIRNPSVHITSFAITEAAAHLGPGTEWGRTHARNAWLLQSSRAWIQHGHLIQSPSSWSSFEDLIVSLSSYADYQYPKKSIFVKALCNTTFLKHLELPAGMFDITPKFMACLAIELPALESIEWGFDYASPKLRAHFVDDFLPGHPRLKKITFLSLSRPNPLSDFNAKCFYSAFAKGSRDLAPATLKYVRYRDLNDSNGKLRNGEFTQSDVYYHRENMADGTWWLKIPARKAESMFEDGRTPKI